MGGEREAEGEGRSAGDNSADFTVFHRGLPCLPLLTSKHCVLAQSALPATSAEKKLAISPRTKLRTKFLKLTLPFKRGFSALCGRPELPHAGIQTSTTEKGSFYRDVFRNLGSFPRCLTGSAAALAVCGLMGVVFAIMLGRLDLGSLAASPWSSAGHPIFAGS